MDKDKDYQQSRKPIDSDFQQQRLRAWQPLLTPNWVIGVFSLIGAIFVVIGPFLLMASRSVVEYELRYDDLTPSCNVSLPNTCQTSVTFNIDKDMKQPVYVYYKLKNFYQNHRRYVKSRSETQLRGDSNPSTATCDPLSSWNGKTLYPCGLIANSFFNDTFDGTLMRAGSLPTSLGNGTNSNPDNPSWQKTGIAWKSDLDVKFHARLIDNNTETDIGPGGYKLPSVEDEDFIVWMRTAGLPTFRKLYRKINRDFLAGDQLVINITNVFPVSSFNGQKSIVISTTSWLGGKNDFLGLAYIVVGIICLCLAIIFFIKSKVSPRPLGDIKYFHWPGQNGTPSS